MFNLTKEQENRLDYYINDSMEELWNIVDDAREKADPAVCFNAPVLFSFPFCCWPRAPRRLPGSLP